MGEIRGCSIPATGPTSVSFSLAAETRIGQAEQSGSAVLRETAQVDRAM
jgi:hypothetical protein